MDKEKEDLLDDIMEMFSASVENNKWENKSKNIKFLDWIIKYLDEKTTIMDDTFDYTENELKEFTVEEFHNLFSLFANFVFNYAEKNHFNLYCLSENGFTEKTVAVLIKEKYYLLELVSGQGSFYRLRLLNDKETDLLEEIYFVVYDDILNNKTSKFKEQNIVDKIIENICDFTTYNDISIEKYLTITKNLELQD